jgi:hypothetical protein
MVTCGNSTTQLTNRGDIEDFAVSNERASMAYTMSRTIERTATTERVATETSTIDLTSGKQKKFEDVDGVVSTCGSLLPVKARSPRLGVQDLLTGAELSYQPYKWFRCSSDRNIVVGTDKNPGGDLYLGVPPKIKIAGTGTFNPYRFNVSPDGSKVAYLNSRLCVFSKSDAIQCSDESVRVSDTPSVNDSGEALVSAGTGKECFYRSHFDFSPRPFPGATDEARDECTGVGYWKRGVESVRIIEPLGRNPQWISPATADLMRRWKNSLAKTR